MMVDSGFVSEVGRVGASSVGAVSILCRASWLFGGLRVDQNIS